MATEENGHRHGLAQRLVFIKNAARLTGQHNETGLVLAGDLLAVDGHITKAGLRILDHCDAGREVAPAIMLGGKHGRDFQQIHITAGNFHCLDRRTSRINGYRRDIAPETGADLAQ